MQITALAVLIVILFPVVSLTDDLLACTAPAEIEHLVRRDLQDQPTGHVDTAPVILVSSFAFHHPICSGTVSEPSLSMKIGVPSDESLVVRGNRPPPCS